MPAIVTTLVAILAQRYAQILFVLLDVVRIAWSWLATYCAVHLLDGRKMFALFC
jgi:hypothetical protein